MRVLALLLLVLLTGCSKKVSENKYTLTYQVRGEGVATISFNEGMRGVGLHQRQLPWSVTIYDELPEELRLITQSTANTTSRIIVNGEIVAKGFTTSRNRESKLVVR